MRDCTRKMEKVAKKAQSEVKNVWKNRFMIFLWRNGRGAKKIDRADHPTTLYLLVNKQKPRKNRTEGAGAGRRGIYKALYGRAMGRWPQGKPRMRWVHNVHQDATSLGARDWQVSARDRRQLKAVVEAAIELYTL